MIGKMLFHNTEYFRECLHPSHASCLWGSSASDISETGKPTDNCKYENAKVYTKQNARKLKDAL